MTANTPALLPCPFCGHAPQDEQDYLHPVGTVWIQNGKFRSYRSRKDMAHWDGQCFGLHCLTHEGGCGAEIVADSREEAIAAWNRRAASPPPVQAAPPAAERGEAVAWLEPGTGNSAWPEDIARARLTHPEDYTDWFPVYLHPADPRPGDAGLRARLNAVIETLRKRRLHVPDPGNAFSICDAIAGEIANALTKTAAPPKKAGS